MREKFEALAKVSGWSGTLSRSAENFDYTADPASISLLIEHVIQVLKRRELMGVELTRSLERQQLELDASKEQVSLASTRVKEMREKIGFFERNEVELNGRISSLSAQVAILEQNVKREHSQASWSNEELQKTLDSFAAFRRDQATILSEIRTKAEESITQSQESTQRTQRLSQIVKEREKQINDLQEHLASLKSELASKESQFTHEMNTSSRMLEMYRSASEDASSRIELLQNEIEELRELLVSAETEESTRISDLEAELESRANYLQEKDVQLEKLRTALDGLLKITKGVQGEIEPLSPTAEILKEFGSNETSDVSIPIKQLYSEYITTRALLAKSDEEGSRLRSTLNEVLLDVNTRAPTFDTLREDNFRLQNDVTSLTEQLIETSTVRDTVINEKSDLERAVSQLSSENVSLKQECSDLSQQVQRLLFEIEGNDFDSKDSGNKRPRPAKSNVSMDVLDASNIITENFVDLTSIAQLQQRNQDLLRSLRAISTKYEALERERESPQLKAQLEAALKDLEEMHEARRRQAQMVETILKTKPQNGTESDKAVLAQDSLRVSNEVEQLRKQLGEKQVTLSQTFTELDGIRAKLAEEQVQKARISAQLELNQDRLKLAQDALSQERLESSSARDRISSQIDGICSAQASVQRLMADLCTAQDREAHLRAQLEKYQADLNNVSRESARIQQESLCVSNERDRLASLLTTMQGVLSEHEASESSLKRHFSTQLEFMERELESARARASETASMHMSALASVERDRSELLKRLEGLTDELSQRREAILRLEATVAQSQEKINDLERVLQHAASESITEDTNTKKSELKLRAMTIDLKNQQAAYAEIQSKVTELESQLQEFENVKLQLSSESESRQNLENSLQEANSQLNHISGDKQRLEEQLEEQIQRHDELQVLIQQYTTEIETLRSQLSESSSLSSSLTAEKEKLSAQLDEAQRLCGSLESTAIVSENERVRLMNLIEELNARIEELISQNNTLLDNAQTFYSENDQMGSELLVSSEDTSAGASANGSIIKFLREEKDKLILERDRLVSDVKRAQSQAEEVRSILASERASVSAQSADYSRLLEQVERFNEIREVGTRAKLECEQLTLKVTMLESQVKEKNKTVLPLKESLDKAQLEIEHLKESLTILQRDRDAWQNRFETAIKNASDNVPLESELKQAKLQGEMFRQRAITLTKNLAETKSAAQREISELQSEITNLQGRIETISHEKEKLELEQQSSSVSVNVNNNHISHNNEEESVDVEMKSDDNENEVMESSEPVEEDNEKDSIDMQITEKDSDVHSEKEVVPVVVEGNEEQEQQEREAAVEEESAEYNEVEDDDSIYVAAEEESSSSDENDSSVLETTEDITSVHVTAPFTPVPVTAPETVTPTAQISTEVPPSVEAPRKKIVSLANIVGKTSSSVPVIAPTMITTASGKKFIPVTFPDPPSHSHSHSTNSQTSTSTSSTAPAASTSENVSTSISPAKSKKNKKGMLKKLKKRSGANNNQ